MKTNPIYMLEPYQKEMKAKVLEVVKESENQYRLILDQTVFYPMGGGQATDQGKLKLADGSEVEVYQVMLKDGEIWHYVKSSDAIIEGDEVEGTIDWDRRYKNMKLHSGGHIIDFSMYVLGYSPKRLVPQKADHNKKPYIQYKGTLDKDIKQELEDKANELIKDDLEFSWEFEDLKELEKEALYLQPGLPTNKPLRVLRLQGIGAVADGGTIVKNTSEVDGIKIANVEVNDGNTIVYYSIQSQKSEGEIHNLPSKNVKINNDNNVGADLSKYGLNPERILTDLKKTISQNLTEVGLTNLYRDYLGKDGIVTNYTKNIINVDSSDRKDYGSSVNLLKNQIDIEVNNAKDALKNSRVNEYLNRTLAELTNDKPKVGHLHPLTETINDMNKIFMSLGYSVMDGPEIETDEYNFVRTNLPPDHPARDLQDSIYIEEPNILLRTQTSSIEARILEKYKPPFKVVMPGRVYRNEKVNKSNHFTFHQYQLVCVQEKVSLADLFATIKYLFDNYLG